MKERTRKILEYIVENKRVSCSEIQEKFNIVDHLKLLVTIF